MYVSEIPVVLIRRRGLVVKKSVIERGGSPVGEYIYVKRGLFEAEAEYDLEDGVLYYLQVCWLGTCAVWYDGEPDRPVPPHLARRALAYFGELAKFSHAAVAAMRVLTSSLGHSSPLSTSDLTHRQPQ
ncbi:hypothetical protein [Pyrobaculum neutrophilum]|uniref:hypothetical protein n=1 Tax=Pyrobaculum neutrophilum TaxID=70771 RepID=UPI001FE1C213|nr:hypothetical protein [Pyrobaculum neutrophilum]